jgi:hypothetical protein
MGGRVSAIEASPELSQFAPVLTRLQSESVAHFGTPHVKLIPLTHEERPFSHLLRVAVLRSPATSPDLHLFVKLFKPKPHDGGVVKMRERVAHDFEVSRRIYEALHSAAGAGAVRPVVCYVDHLAIVSEEAAGVTLMAHLDAHARWFPTAASLSAARDALSAIGRWLRQFQGIDPGTGRVNPQDLRDYVDIRLQRLVTHGFYTPEQRERVLRHLDGLSRHVAAADLADVIVHADLAPGNILINGSHVVVLDFAMVQRGCSLHDISRLWIQLDALRAKPQFRGRVVRDLQRALLSGFDETLTPERPLFRYLVVLHRINHYASLSLSRERFLARALSNRVRRLHASWIERELASPFERAVEARS